jgi:hypothetical protein
LKRSAVQPPPLISSDHLQILPERSPYFNLHSEIWEWARIYSSPTPLYQIAIESRTEATEHGGVF